MERYLRELLPDARIAVGHGQMDEETLSVAMDDFTARRADILLCTAIIEAGLDLPNANTILVNHAHRFGWPRRTSSGAAWAATATGRTRTSSSRRTWPSPGTPPGGSP